MNHTWVLVKSKLLARTLVYWPKWNEDIEQVCAECESCRENQHMPPNIPKFQVNARGPGEGLWLWTSQKYKAGNTLW